MKKRFIGVIVSLVLVATAVPIATVSAQTAGPLDHVVIIPNSVTIPADDYQQFTAVGQDSDNITIGHVSYTWAVVAGGGTINNKGLFTAANITGMYLNTIQVKAVKGGVERFAYATVNITAPRLLDHVVISPKSVTIPAGEEQQFTATGEDSDNVSIRNVSYTWAVVAGGGTINNEGLFKAGDTAGTYTNTIQVKVVKGGIERVAYATVSVTVTVVPEENEAPVPPGWSNGKKVGWNGGDTPPGWSKGKKTGWRGEKMPPGLLKSDD